MLEMSNYDPLNKIIRGKGDECRNNNAEMGFYNIWIAFLLAWIKAGQTAPLQA
jgi:hypothetical protein